MGGTGGGHYTAYAKHPVDGNWYSYNDSSVSPVGGDVESRVVSDSAYNLFYRRRDPKIDIIDMDFDKVQQIAHTGFLEMIDEKRKAAEAAKKAKIEEEKKK